MTKSGAARLNLRERICLVLPDPPTRGPSFQDGIVLGLPFLWIFMGGSEMGETANV